MCFELYKSVFNECGCSYIWSVDIQNCEFLLVDFTFDEYKVSSLSFLITLGWKSILLDIRMATLACFLRPFAWKIIL